MKIFLLSILLTLVACSKVPESPTDEYVLVEFASKLEEDYQKYEPKDDLKSSPSTKKPKKN